MAKLNENGFTKSTQSAAQMTSVTAGANANEEEMRKKTRPVPVVLWKTVDVMKWLKRCCADHYQLYAHLFLEHDITGRSLVRINDISLEKMGIRDRNHRSELLREILKLKLKSDILEIKDLERDGAEFFKASS
ncbi:protein aveugle-like [Tropilaelaps mercedesae]|uniref:Protein aveugle-like n=1 Tax=Tropilaelaps mercedesae TaxID=418985 RepID=A0A1V9X1Y4_9ACAR|nr:protein aveugle-like [Tropilaelaps mercedesae]